MAEQRKRRPQQDYRILTKAWPEGVLITDRHGMLVYVNPALEEMFGIPASVSVGTHFRNYITAASAQSAEALFRGCAQGKIVRDVSLEAIHEDGCVFHIEIAAIPILRGGRFEGIKSIVRDITRQKCAEEAMQASEQRFRSVLENSLDAAYRRDVQHSRYDYISPAIERIIGFTPAEMGTFDNDDLLARVHPDDVERVRREFVQAIADGTGAVEYRFRCKNGDYRWLADYFVAQKDEAGRAMYLTGSIRDITGLKQTERALRNSERRFRKLFEADLMGVFITTPDGTFLDCNDAMVKMLRYDSREELIQCRSSDLYVDPEFRRDAIRVLRTEGVYLGREGRIRRKDGSIAYLLGAAVLLQDEETGEPYVQGVAVDITERKQAEEALRELTQTLESKVAERTAELQRRAQQLQKIMIELLETEDRERTRLAEVLHDDLQQELAAVKFHIGLMKEQARLNPALEATAAEVEHMIKDAIDKSRSLSHELSPAIMHHGDFAETIRWLANEVQARHGLVVHVQIDGEVRVESHAIKSLLIRAVQELLFNVVKHAHVKEARIDVRQYDHRIGLSVSDFGRGFNPQSLEQTVGFGLLSIRERVQLLRGRMKIKSLPGRGSRFSIIVPAGEPTPASPSSETAPSPSIAEESHDGHRLRVLLADDHEIVRQGLVSLLGEEHSVQVVGEASNGREAVTLAERLDPDIVIMDVSMPVMGGEEATRSIKERLPHTRVVALSIIDDPGVREAMRAAGADAYVLKTASLDELLTAIRGESRTHDTLLTASPA